MTLQIPKFVRLFFLCILAATMTMAQQISAHAPQPGTIMGTVIDGNGDAVANSSVVQWQPQLRA